MGYILPIPHYQYSDYQNRDIHKKLDPFYIEGPYKVLLEYHDWEEDENSDEKKKHHRPNDTLSDRKLEKGRKHIDYNPNREKVYAELTGKGRKYNATV